MKGWTQSRAFTMVTEILDSGDGAASSGHLAAAPRAGTATADADADADADGRGRGRGVAAAAPAPAYESCLSQFCVAAVAGCGRDRVCAPVWSQCKAESELFVVFQYLSANLTGNAAVRAVLRCGDRALCVDAEAPEKTLPAQCLADNCLGPARACSEDSACRPAWLCARRCGLGLACVRNCTAPAPAPAAPAPSGNALYAALARCVAQDCAAPGAPVGKGAVCCPCKAQYTAHQCTPADALCRRPAPPCLAPLKCYSSSLIDSGTCVSTPLAGPNQTCCIFPSATCTAPPCDSGLKCVTADPDSPGACGHFD